jgi:hypothetical protein
MAITLKIEGLDAVSRAFSSLGTGTEAGASTSAGIKVEGPAAAYALVWEIGRMDVNPGPKTMWSENADGEAAVMTIQAPNGYIRINRQEYVKILNEEFASVKWSELSPSQWLSAANDVVDMAAQRCLNMLQNYVPVDTGQLLFNMEVATHGDSALANANDGDGYAGWNH